MKRYVIGILMVLLVISPAMAYDLYVERNHKSGYDTQGHWHAVRRCRVGDGVMVTSGYCTAAPRYYQYSVVQKYNEGERLSTKPGTKILFERPVRIDSYVDCSPGSKGYCPAMRRSARERELDHWKKIAATRTIQEGETAVLPIPASGGSGSGYISS